MQTNKSASYYAWNDSTKNRFLVIRLESDSIPRGKWSTNFKDRIVNWRWVKSPAANSLQSCGNEANAKLRLALLRKYWEYNIQNELNSIDWNRKCINSGNLCYDFEGHSWRIEKSNKKIATLQECLDTTLTLYHITTTTVSDLVEI